MSLFQIFLVDNIINGLNFTINYFLTTNKKIIVNKYVNLYELNILERYSVYFLIYLFKCFLEEFDIYFNDYILLIITIPYLQNTIKYLKCYSSYINIKKTFIKYTISKYSIHFLQDLHQDIIKIPNYNIFLLYNLITIEYVTNIIKMLLFISLLYFLKYKKELYYYYKIIKMSYKYNKGYNFTEMNLNDAIYVLNIVINEKRWNDLSKMEIINALYIVLIYKYYDSESDFQINILFNTIGILTCWTFIIILKFLFHYHYIFKFLVPIILQSSFINAVFVYYLFQNNINDLVIMMCLYFKFLIHIIIKEVYFVIKNYKSINKFINQLTIQNYEVIKKNDF